MKSVHLGLPLIFLGMAATWGVCPLRASLVGEATTAIGSAFVSACAGTGVYSSINPGIAWNGAQSTGGTVCNSATGSLVSQTSFQTGQNMADPVPFSDNAFGLAAVGAIALSAAHQGDSSYYFPDAVVDAGWNAYVTPNVAGIAGQQAVWVIPFSIFGNFTSTGQDGISEGDVDVWENGAVVQPYNSANNQLAFSTYQSLNTVSNGNGTDNTDQELIAYGARAGNGVPSFTITNNQIFFALPVTVGQQIELGIWASILAGEGSAGASLGADTAGADLAHTILWGGPGYIVSNGTVYNDVTVTSPSSFNFNLPATDPLASPEPSTGLLLALGSIGIYCGISRPFSRRSTRSHFPVPR